VRVPPPKYHSCDYVRQRNALIPQAEKIASAKVATVRDDGESYAAWTRAFSVRLIGWPDPVCVSLFRANAVMLEATDGPNLIEQFRVVQSPRTG